MSAGCKLFVGCLPYSKSEQEIAELFSQFGYVQEVAMMRKPDGSPKGAAFVTFQDKISADASMAGLEGYCFPGSTRAINVSASSSTGGPAAGSGAQPPRPPHGGKAGGKGSPPPPPHAQYGHLGHHPAPDYGAGAAAVAAEVKLFIGQLPYSRHEEDILEVFQKCGFVTEIVLLKDAKSGEKKGAAFIKYASRTEAQYAIDTLDGYFFEGSTRPISVAYASGNGKASPNPPQPQGYAQPQQPNYYSQHHVPTGQPPAPPGMPQGRSRPGTPPQGKGAKQPGAPPAPVDPEAVSPKLFVGQLPFSRTEADILEVFGQFGEVAEVYMHLDAQGQKKGAAFVKYRTEHEAALAMELDGYVFEGATRPITVGFAVNGQKRQKLW